MSLCTVCSQKQCTCDYEYQILEGDEEFLEDLIEYEAYKTPGAKRCLACCFFNCRCAKGLKSKNNK